MNNYPPYKRYIYHIWLQNIAKSIKYVNKYEQNILHAETRAS